MDFYIPCVLLAIMFNQVNCHHTVRRHFMNRRDKTPTTLRTYAYPTNPTRPLPPQTPLPHPKNPYPENVGLPQQNTDYSNANYGLLNGDPRVPSQNMGLPASNAGLPPGSAFSQPENMRLPPEKPELYPGNTGASPGNSKFFPENPKLPPENAPEAIRLLPGGNISPTDVKFNTGHNRISSQSMLAPEPVASVKSQSSVYPAAVNASKRSTNFKRRRKDVTEKEHLKELSKNQKAIKKKHKLNTFDKKKYLKLVNEYLGDDITKSNTTVIPKHKGVQIKTASRKNGWKENALVNIISSTQNIMSSDNATEIENVVEMQMEKKIEDEKGANKGSEEVRIVETEHVKPIINKKLNRPNLRKRRTKIYNKRFIAHHRDKRGLFESTEMPIINSVFDEISGRYLPVVKRKERVVENNKVVHEHKTPFSMGNSVQSRTNSKKHTEAGWPDDGDEMGDFIKFMQKQNTKKVDKRLKKTNLNTAHWKKHRKLPVHNQKIFGIFKYPEHISVFLNLNLKVDSKTIDRPNGLSKIRVDRGYMADMDSTTVAACTTCAEEQRNQTLFPVDLKNVNLTVSFVPQERKQSVELLVVPILILLGIFLIGKLVCSIQKNFCRNASINNMISNLRRQRQYRGYQTEGYKELKSSGIKNVYVENYPHLEWQSENGDWLSDNEPDFK